MNNGKQTARTVFSVITGWTLLKQTGGVVREAIEIPGRLGHLVKFLMKDGLDVEAILLEHPEIHIDQAQDGRWNFRHDDNDQVANAAYWRRGCFTSREKAIRAAFDKYGETFEEATQRHGLTEINVRAVEHSFAKRTAWWFVCLVCSFAIFALTPFVAHPVSHALLSGGVMILSAAKTLVWRFRYCQARDRSLYGFGPWFFSDIWVTRTYIALIAMISIGLLLFAATARAAETGLNAFTPPVGDTSVSFLRQIYGPIIDNIHSGASTQSGKVDSALGAMLAPFNSSMLFLGMIFVAYTTVKGTIDSAHTGEILGKKMSEIWVPIRTVGGTAFLLPLSSGYCLIQIAILWLAIQSAGIADFVLSAGLDYIAETSMVSRPNLPDSRPLAAAIFKAEVCMAAMNKQYQDANQTTRIVEDTNTSLVYNGGEVGIGDAVAIGAMGAVPVAGPALLLGAAAYTVASATSRVTNFRWAANDKSNKQCGLLTWRESDESALGAGNTNIAKGPIMRAQAQAVQQMIADLRPVAQNIVDTSKYPPLGVIETAANRYENTIAVAANAAISNSNDAGRANFIQYAKDGGWIYLPAYYNQLIQLNDAIQSAINALPSAESSNIVEQVGVTEALQNYQDYMTVANEYLKRRDLSAVHAAAQQAKENFAVPTSWESMKRLLSLPAQVAIHDFTQQLAGSNLSHVGQIKAVGDTIVHAGEVLAGIMFTSSGLANGNVAKLTIGNVFDVGAALSSISSLLSTIIMALFVFGAWAAYYIPMIPFIAAITAIIKWFVMVFEMVIAAPIMAAAHIHPDGDDMVGKAAAGYMLILNLVMWPTLTVFGFFGSIWLAQPVTGLVNTLYMTAVLGAEHNSFTGLVALVAYVSIYVLIMTGVVHSIFTLVNWLPTHALRVIGGSMGVPEMSGDDGQSKFYGGAGNFQRESMPKKGGTPNVSSPSGGGKGGHGGDEKEGKDKPPTTKELMD